MPVFENKDKSGARLDAYRPVVRRGVRLDKDTIRRIRDILYVVLLGMGLDPEDCSSVLAAAVTARQIRNRIDRDIPFDMRQSLTKLAEEIVASVHERMPATRPRYRRAQSSVRQMYRQLLLFGDDDVEG